MASVSAFSLSAVQFMYLYWATHFIPTNLTVTSNWMSIFNTPFTQKTDYKEETSKGQNSQQLFWFGALIVLKILSLRFQ